LQDSIGNYLKDVNQILINEIKKTYDLIDERNRNENIKNNKIVNAKKVKPDPKILNTNLKIDKIEPVSIDADEIIVYLKDLLKESKENKKLHPVLVDTVSHFNYQF